MKEAAEGVLRELPSVVGACVREDVFGHPREIHLLVRSGPDPRHLAHDVRDLLEERLGVAIDQRVISIAQLAPEAAVPAAQGSPAASAVAAGAAATSPALRAAAPPPARPASDPRLRFIGVETEVRDVRVLVRVRLQLGARELVGEALELEAGHGRARAGATAALQAVSAAADVHGRFEMENASLVRVLDRDYVLVSAFASSPYLGRKPLTLAGAQPVDVDVESAAALGALKAVNRVLALMLRMASRER